MIRFSFAALIAVTGSVAASQPAPYIPPPISEGDTTPMHVREIKSMRDFVLAARYPFTVKVRFLDDLDGEPIEGVHLGSAVSGPDGWATLHLPGERGALLGSKHYVGVSFPSGQQDLKKHSDAIDAATFVQPYSVKFWIGDLAPTEPLVSEVRLKRSDISVSGTVRVDDKRVFQPGIGRESLPIEVFTSENVRGSNAVADAAGSVRLGPFASLPKWGFVQVDVHVRRFQLRPDFEASIQLPPLGRNYLAIGCVENEVMFAIETADQPELHEGTTLIRMQDQVAVTFRYASIATKLQAGDYVVLPGHLRGQDFYNVVFDALAQGIDLSKRGFTIASLVDSGEEQPKPVTLKYSVLATFEAVKRLERELAERDAAKEAAGLPPTNAEPANAIEPK